MLTLLWVGAPTSRHILAPVLADTVVGTRWPNAEAGFGTGWDLIAGIKSCFPAGVSKQGAADGLADG